MGGIIIVFELLFVLVDGAVWDEFFIVVDVLLFDGFVDIV